MQKSYWEAALEKEKLGSRRPIGQGSLLLELEPTRIQSPSP